MKFQEILNHLSGISCPIFGISWNPGEIDVSRARRVITFLEDRRVLYVPSEMESPDRCVQSVLEIRHFLTSELTHLDFSDELSTSLRVMRIACRKFLSTVEIDEDRVMRFGGHHNHSASWVFNGALGELRCAFGIQLASVAAQYGLDVEDELASIFPGKDDGDTEEKFPL